MRILNTLRLTDNQKRVIAKIIAAQTPKIASEKISTDQNIIAARDQLMKLGLITFNPSKASITKKGLLVARQENIIDDAKQLTPEGEKFAYSSPQEPSEQEVKTENYIPGKTLKELFNF